MVMATSILGTALDSRSSLVWWRAMTCALPHSVVASAAPNFEGTGGIDADPAMMTHHRTMIPHGVFPLKVTMRIFK